MPSTEFHWSATLRDPGGCKNDPYDDDQFLRMHDILGPFPARIMAQRLNRENTLRRPVICSPINTGLEATITSPSLEDTFISFRPVRTGADEMKTVITLICVNVTV